MQRLKVNLIFTFTSILWTIGAGLLSLQLPVYAADPDKQSTMNQAAVDVFLTAASVDDVERLTDGWKAGVPIDSIDSKGRTALLIATYANSINAARFLVNHGANVNVKDQLQDSPYLYAGAEGKLEILKMTVAAGADLQSVNRYGGTALTPAAHHGHEEVVRYLLTTTIDVNQVNSLGWTALLEAVILGDGGPVYQRIIELLLKAGADTSLADDKGVTPLQHAKERGYAHITSLLTRSD